MDERKPLIVGVAFFDAPPTPEVILGTSVAMVAGAYNRSHFR